MMNRTAGFAARALSLKPAAMEGPAQTSPDADASLAARAIDANAGWLKMPRSGAGQPPAARREWLVSGAVALLLAAGPAATILIANGRAAAAEREAAKLDQEAAPRLAEARAADGARETLRTALRHPALGPTIEALARALPADATLARVERMADGALEIEVATPDPDSLRGALRNVPGLGDLREMTQRRGDALMLVTFRSAGA